MFNSPAIVIHNSTQQRTNKKKKKKKETNAKTKTRKILLENKTNEGEKNTGVELQRIFQADYKYYFTETHYCVHG